MNYRTLLGGPASTPSPFSASKREIAVDLGDDEESGRIITPTSCHRTQVIRDDKDLRWPVLYGIFHFFGAFNSGR